MYCYTLRCKREKMFHKITLLLIALQILFISCYAKEPTIPPKDKQLLSKDLSKKIVMPINIQAIDQNSYLLYENITSMNRLIQQYRAKKTNTFKTNCVVKHINSNGVLKKLNHYGLKVHRFFRGLKVHSLL